MWGLDTQPPRQQLIVRAPRSRAPPPSPSLCPRVSGPGAHESRAGEQVDHGEQPGAEVELALLTEPLERKSSAQGGRADLAMPREQITTAAQKLLHAYCRVGVESLPPRRSGAGAAGTRTRGGGRRGFPRPLTPCLRPRWAGFENLGFRRRLRPPPELACKSPQQQ